MKLLSICIPTYNRAKYLKICLNSIINDIKGLEDEVEIVVSDNCSTDNTEEIAREIFSNIEFCYFKNSTNIGGNRNIIRAAEIASGEFCWIIGDDDFILPGSIHRLIKLIKENEEIDYYFASCVHIEKDALDKINGINSSRDLPKNLRPDNSFSINKNLSSWDELIDYNINGVFLGAMQVSIFRKSVWDKYARKIKIEGDPFYSLENTYPHAVIFAHVMPGRPAYYIGEPLIAVLDGNRDWIGYVPIILIFRLPELLELYKKQGIDSGRIEKCKKELVLNTSFYLLTNLLTNYSFPRTKHMALKYFIRNARYLEFWKGIMLPIYRIIKNHLLKSQS